MSEIKDIGLADSGKKRILWAEKQMPVLRQIRNEFEKTKPFLNKRISACLHVTKETAVLMLTLKAGGAKLSLCASNPLSTQDDVSASLVRDYDISVFAIKGENNDKYYEHINACLDFKPNLTMDDGADLVFTLHKERLNQINEIIGSQEETTTGVIRLKAMEKDNMLKIPVIAINDAKTKYLFDNRYGTGQSTIDGILRATSELIAGKNVVVAGYGWCGKGVALRARGMGANVIVTEVDAIKALEAVMDGFSVLPMIEASKIGDIFITVSGNIDIIRKEHFEVMKDSAIIANSGHFDVEININELKQVTKKINYEVKPLVDEYELPNGNRIYLLANGRLINLSAGEGHPAAVMDMSFSVQALCAKWLFENYKDLVPKVYPVPDEIDNEISLKKLASMNVKIDKLTDKQKEYLSNWRYGT